MRIIVAIVSLGFVFYFSVNTYGQKQSNHKASGYEKVVRPWSSLWKGDCESDADGKSCTYFRFYADGTLIAVSTSGNPREIKRWFRRPYNDTGKYIISGDKIRFSRISPQGTIDYEGVIDRDVLRLKIFSHINQYRHSETYSWVKPRQKARAKK